MRGSKRTSERQASSHPRIEARLPSQLSAICRRWDRSGNETFGRAADGGLAERRGSSSFARRSHSSFRTVSKSCPPKKIPTTRTSAGSTTKVIVTRRRKPMVRSAGQPSPPGSGPGAQHDPAPAARRRPGPSPGGGAGPGRHCVPARPGGGRHAGGRRRRKPHRFAPQAERSAGDPSDLSQRPKG